jgi:hypothetical protein
MGGNAVGWWGSSLRRASRDGARPGQGLVTVNGGTAPTRRAGGGDAPASPVPWPSPAQAPRRIFRGQVFLGGNARKNAWDGALEKKHNYR